MKRLLAWWHRMRLEYHRRQAGRAALALLLARGEERTQICQRFHAMSAKLKRMERP